MTDTGRPLVPYMRQSRAKERTISIEDSAVKSAWRRDALQATNTSGASPY
jgi:hypothetical protein